MGLKLNIVSIKGNKHLENSKIIEAIGGDVGTPIFALDLKEIYQRIDNFSWVENVSIRRKLPDTIEVRITERKPIAIWQNNLKLSLIDAEGSIIEVDDIERFIGLLQVVGKGANIHTQDLIDSLKKEPGIYQNVTAAVRFGERRWNLILRGDITIKMPERGFLEALNYMARMNRQKKLFDQNYKMLDLRNSEKYYIEKYKSKR